MQKPCHVCKGTKIEPVEWIVIKKGGKKKLERMQVRCTHCAGTGVEPLLENEEVS